MALKYSSMLALGTKIPTFQLLDTVSNSMYNSIQLDNKKPTLIMVICNHCPYVIHYHQELKRLFNDFNQQLDFVAMSSNDATLYPQDGPEEMSKLFRALKLDFPYLYDQTQETTKLLNAECTPEFYLYDGNNLLVYRGRLDASSPGKDLPVTGEDLRKAINSLLMGQVVSLDQHPSMGCSIKWK